MSPLKNLVFENLYFIDSTVDPPKACCIWE